MINQDNYIVYKISPNGQWKHGIFQGTNKECNAFCDSMNWQVIAEYGYIWTLKIVKLFD